MTAAACGLLHIVSFLGFTVGPARVDKALFGSPSVTELFEVQNFSGDSLRIRIGFEDFDIDLRGRVSFSAGGTVVNSLAPHVVTNPEEFFIAPQQAEYVRVTFQPPPSGTASEYYGMMVFRSQPIPTRYSPRIAIAGEIGVPVYYVVTNLIGRDAAFESLYVEKDSAFFHLKNTGNIHLRVRGEAKIVGSEGVELDRDSIPEFVVFPQRTRIVAVPVDPGLAGDIYTVRIRLDYGASHLIEGERRFAK